MLVQTLPLPNLNSLEMVTVYPPRLEFKTANYSNPELIHPAFLIFHIIRLWGNYNGNLQK